MVVAVDGSEFSDYALECKYLCIKFSYLCITSTITENNK